MPTWIARRVMALATSNLPAERGVWGQAMRAEFESLQTGRLSWALGCLVAALGWRLGKDWLFLVAVVAVALTVDDALFLPPGLTLWLTSHGLFHLGLLACPALACAALAIWRPAYALGAAVAMPLLQLAQAAFQFTVVAHVSLEHGFNIMNAPMLVGASAMLGWCLVGALLGRQFAGHRKTVAA